MAGFEEGSPFPGESLARLLQAPTPAAPADSAAGDQTLAEVVPFDPRNPDPAQMLEPRWPLGALADGDWTYIRREGDVLEELFRLRDDAQEQHNLAGDVTARPIIERMRQALLRLTGGPLTPGRFNR